MPPRFEVRVRPLRNEADLDWALAEIDKVVDAAPGTSGEARLEVLSTLVEAYERVHHPIEAPDPIAAILFRLEQQGLTRKALEGVIGSRARVSEVLNRKRPLTLQMIRRLKHKFDIPADLLITTLRDLARRLKNAPHPGAQYLDAVEEASRRQPALPKAPWNRS